MISETLFPLQMQNAVAEAVSLEEVAATLAEQAVQVERKLRRIGFVVGKITPSEGKTLEANKALLLRRTLAIAALVSEQGVDVFSSAVIPDSLEGRFPPQDFYAVFDAFVRNARIIYTTAGWESSWGARNEVAIAREHMIDVIHYREGKLLKDD